MLWLYLLGPIIEPLLGKRRFIALYVLSGLVGGATFLLMELSGVRGLDHESTLVGASGGILGTMAAAVCVAPRLPIRFWFPPVSIPLWVIFVGSIVMALLTIRMAGWNAGGEGAHLGGAATGLVLFKNRRLLSTFSGRKRSRFWRPGDPSTNFFRDAG
jgi:membrane associated rhomboid family serine protease